MGKVVIVTGAAGWLGSAVAKCFGDAGDKVLVSDINKTGLEEVAAAINKGSGRAIGYTANTRNYEEVKAMVEEAIRLWGRIDVVACVAGGSWHRLRKNEKNMLITEYSSEDWDLVVESNLKGTFHCIKAVAGPMIAQKDGHIIIMGSGTAFRGQVRGAAYAASKAGILGLMKSAALELGEHNIKVNVVAPGRQPHPGEAGDYSQGTALGRTNNPSEVAAFFVRLSRMNNVSGQIFNLDSRILF